MRYVDHISYHLAYRINKLFRHVRVVGERIKGLPQPITNDLTPAMIAGLIDRPAPVLLEIGAHDGSDTVKLLQTMPNARIHCFEPDPRPRRRLIKLLGNERRVSIYPTAIGSANGKVDFHQSDGNLNNSDISWDRSGSIRPPKKHLQQHPRIKFERTCEVDVRRLDDWAAEYEASDIDFIWMDVQGAEGDVIAGGMRTLARTRFIYSEYSNEELYEGQINLATMLHLLPDFEILARYPNDVLLKNRRF